MGQETGRSPGSLGHRCSRRLPAAIAIPPVSRLERKRARAFRCLALTQVSRNQEDTQKWCPL